MSYMPCLQDASHFIKKVKSIASNAVSTPNFSIFHKKDADIKLVPLSSIGIPRSCRAVRQQFQCVQHTPCRDSWLGFCLRLFRCVILFCAAVLRFDFPDNRRFLVWCLHRRSDFLSNRKGHPKVDSDCFLMQLVLNGS